MISNLFVIPATILLVFAFKSSIIGNYKIPSSSMEPAIQVGDRVFANQLSYSCRIPFTSYSINGYEIPERGDVVVFKFPGDPSIDYVKRVIGLPGDRIEFDDGIIILNGDNLPRDKIEEEGIRAEKGRCEQYELWRERINEQEYFIYKKTHRQGSEFGSVVVPEGCVFVLGDNRDDSHDSRVWGYVPLRNLKARVLVVYFSLGDHQGFFHRIRWSRMWKIIR